MKNTSILLIIIAVLAITATAYSYPNGITGRTLKTSTSGCGGCHNQGTTVTGTITGPDSVAAGQTYTFTLTLVSTSGSGKYGVNIAAKTGTLAVISGSGLKLSGGELTQSSSITYVSPKVINFSYTAPSTPGSDTLYATVDRGHTGIWSWAPNVGVRVYTATGITGSQTAVTYKLSQNYPNPFNPSTKISFGIAKSGYVKLSVYDLSGKLVKELINGQREAGSYDVEFRAEGLSSGVYYYKLESEGFSDTKKMLLLK